QASLAPDAPPTHVCHQSLPTRRSSVLAARNMFCEAAQAGCARLHHYRHPSEKGPQGEDLYADVACYGPKDAPRRLLVVSGTHGLDRKSTRLNSSHVKISYAVFCLKKKM